MNLPKILRNERASRTAMIVGTVCALVMSGIGLMIGLWTGTGAGVPTSFALFWILPATALPVFLLKLLWKRMPAIVFWLFFLGQAGCLASSNWAECAHGGCTTRNPFLVALSGLAYPPIWGWAILALVSTLIRPDKKTADRSAAAS
jgi:hypothetical protein